MALLAAREGFPSVTTIARTVKSVKFLMSHQGYNQADVDSNCKAMLLAGDKGPKIMMVDEVACEQALRYDDRCVMAGVSGVRQRGGCLLVALWVVDSFGFV